MEKEMGKVETEITLTNVMDRGGANQGFMPESKIRQATVQAIVDTGASTLVINEAIRQELGLTIEGKRRITFANGGQQECALTGPVDIRWKERECTCRAVVIPNAGSVLLGAIPLEDMDLIVSPLKQEVVGAHGDVVEALAL
jgi:clan AA aspartic protease